MECRICRLKNRDLLREIESRLKNSNGILSSQDKKELTNKFNDESEVELINSLSDDECSLHFNFHMAPDYDVPMATKKDNDDEPSLTKDINKNEATVLYQMMTTQAATFNLITNKINKEIKDAESLQELGLPNNLLALYKDTAESIRATAKAIKDINADVNGSKSGALEGLKALANALKDDDNEPKKELTTDEYDY